MTHTITDVAKAAAQVDETNKNMRLFSLAVGNAETMVGKAVFDFQPTIIKRALVSDAVVTLLNAQDEDVPAERIRRALNALEQIINTAVTDAGIVGR